MIVRIPDFLSLHQLLSFEHSNSCQQCLHLFSHDGFQLGVFFFKGGNLVLLSSQLTLLLLHGFYQDCRVLGEGIEPALTVARLWLVEGARIGLAVALDLLGVGAPTEMWREAQAGEQSEGERV